MYTRYILCILVQELSEHTADVHVQNDALDGMFTFYDATKATLNVYQVYRKTKCTSLLMFNPAFKLLLRYHQIDVTSHGNCFLTYPGCKCYFWSAVPFGAWFLFDRSLLLPSNHYTGMNHIFVWSTLDITSTFFSPQLRKYCLLEQGVDDLINIFRRPPSRKLKGA